MPQTQRLHLPFIAEVLSKAGGRDANEDWCDYAEADRAGCWVVADGLGGHQGGGVAASIVVDAALASFRVNPKCSADAVAGHVMAAQIELARSQRLDPALEGMRSTVVVMVTDFRQLVWGHVGDSRLYYLDHGGLACRTEDDSVAQALVHASRITDAEARHHPDRSRLLRSLGGQDGWQPTICREPQVLHRGAAVLLCTDGFWAEVTDGEMLVDLAKSNAPADWLARMEARLLERAPDDCDNYTAVAIFFPSASTPPPARAPIRPRAAAGRLPLALVAAIITVCFVALLFAAAKFFIPAIVPGGQPHGVAPGRTVDGPAPTPGVQD